MASRELCTQNTFMNPRKTLGTQTPNTRFPRDLSAWDNNAAPELMRDHKTVSSARLHLLAVSFPCWELTQLTPAEPQQLTLTLHALPWSLHNQEAQKIPSHSTMKCSLNLPSPGTVFPFIASTLQPSHVQSPLPVGRHRSRCRARDKRCLSRARSKPSQDRPWAMRPSK